MSVTKRSTVVVAIALALAAAVALPAPTALANHRTTYTSGPDYEFGEMVDYPLVFPLEGSFDFADWFWASRGGGVHHAIDIMAPRWTPVLAVADGVIHSVNYSRNPDDIDPERCCTIILRHDDDWRSWYIHLNNDSAGLPPGTCDGKGWGIADGILPGVTVKAGQLIGWVGSSGNASCNGPHLHYELHDPYGVIVNPYQSLRNPISPTYCTPDAGCVRLAGATRYETAQAVSEAHHLEPADVSRVYVASGANFPDALAGATVAALSGSPILLVHPTAIPTAAAEELQRLGADEIVILGGTSSVSSSIESQLAGSAFGSPTVIRVAGPDRYATSVEISRHAFGDGEPDAVVIASGEGFPDALPAGTLAARLGAPVLLTRGGELPGIVVDEILRLAPSQLYVLGGPATISDAVLASLRALAPTERVAGPNRYATAVEASKLAFPNSATPVGRAYFTVGTNFPDGLTGGAAAGMLDSPILLVPSTTLPEVVRAEILRLGPEFLVILGGTNSVGPSVELTLMSLIAG